MPETPDLASLLQNIAAKTAASRGGQIPISQQTQGRAEFVSQRLGGGMGDYGTFAGEGNKSLQEMVETLSQFRQAVDEAKVGLEDGGAALERYQQALEKSAGQDYAKVLMDGAKAAEAEAKAKQQLIKDTLAQVKATKDSSKATKELIKDLQKQQREMSKFNKFMSSQGGQFAQKAMGDVQKALEGTTLGLVMGTGIAGLRGGMQGGLAGVGFGIGSFLTEQFIARWVQYTALIEEVREGIGSLGGAFGDFAAELGQEDKYFDLVDRGLTEWGIKIEETQQALDVFAKAGLKPTEENLEKTSSLYFALTKTMDVGQGTFTRNYQMMKRMFGRGPESMAAFFEEFYKKTEDGTRTQAKAFQEEWGMSIDAVSNLVMDLTDQFYNMNMTFDDHRANIVKIRDQYDLTAESSKRMYQGLLSGLTGMGVGQRAWMAGGGIGGAAKFKYGGLSQDEMEGAVAQMADALGFDFTSLKKGGGASTAQRWEAVGMMEQMGLGGDVTTRMFGLQTTESRKKGAEAEREAVTVAEDMWKRAVEHLEKYRDIQSTLHEQQLDFSATMMKLWRLAEDDPAIRDAYQKVTNEYNDALKNMGEARAEAEESNNSRLVREYDQAMDDVSKRFKIAQEDLATGTEEGIERAKAGAPRSGFFETGWGGYQIEEYRRQYGQGRYFGGPIGYYQGGGEIPIIAHGGEFMMSQRATESIGRENLHSMNQTGQLPGGGGSLDININGADFMMGLQGVVRDFVEDFIMRKIQGQV